MKLSEFYSEEDTQELQFIWKPLLKAMAAGTKELEVTADEFVVAMRSAITANVYHHVFADGSDYPTILAMKIIVI